PAKLNDEQRKLIKTYTPQLDAEAAASLAPAQQAELDLNKKHIEDLRRATPDVPRAYYLREPGPKVPPTYLLIPGKADQPGPEVTPAVPVVLRQAPLDFPEPRRTSLRRLTFAQWLVSPENPLTARVIVNHVWQHHFKKNLVRTPSDFGVMG